MEFHKYFQLKFLKLKEAHRLIIYRNDPIFVFVHNRRERLRWYHLFLFYFIFFIGIKIVINLISGTLYSTTLINDIKSDFLFFIHRLFGIGNIDTNYSYTIPYLRDYFDILLGILFSLHTTLLHYKWYNLSTGFKKIFKKGAFNEKIISEVEYKSLTKLYDKIFNNILINISALMGSITMTYLVFLGFKNVGMFSLLKGLMILHGVWQLLILGGPIHLRMIQFWGNFLSFIGV